MFFAIVIQTKLNSLSYPCVYYVNSRVYESGVTNSPFLKAFYGRRHSVSGDERSEIVGDLFMKPAKTDWLYIL
jgi:hypothetical protein